MLQIISCGKYMNQNFMYDASESKCQIYPARTDQCARQVGICETGINYTFNFYIVLLLYLSKYELKNKISNLVLLKLNLFLFLTFGETHVRSTATHLKTVNCTRNCTVSCAMKLELL